jgi:nitrite reductase/ring-hydroxylating ferredoxin subunit/DMSO/TMAO reductase YedYZ heme-binding membrane subunit
VIHEQRVGHFRAFVGLAALLPVGITWGIASRPETAHAEDDGAGMLWIRALGIGAFVLLHVVLCIGPLARLEARFLPLLRRRRGLGVATFALGLAHGVLVVAQLHSGGALPPLVSLLTGGPGPDEVSAFPFQPLGFAALLVLSLMAATSHDFWLRTLTPAVWKSLHMLVYIAYALLVMHVVLGALQWEHDPVPLALVWAGVAIVTGLHVVAGWWEVERDVEVLPRSVPEAPWIEAGSVDDIPERRAKVVFLSGERVAIFRYDGRVSAVSAVCPHQNGPLGEGRIVDGCIRCPWHGSRVLPDSGRSPDLLTEPIPTFGVRVVRGRVWIDPRPNAPGTRVEPARVEPTA